MPYTETGTILMESKRAMRKIHKLDMTSPVDYKNMLVDDEAYNTYKESLLESVGEGPSKQNLSKMFDKTRAKLLESVANSFNQLSNYETLALPLLSNFYPRLVSKELVTVKPITSPDTILPFLNYTFVKPNGEVIGTAPSYQTVSFGPAVTKSSGKYVTPGKTDILAANGHDASMTSVERTFQFFKFEATVGGTAVSIEHDLLPTVDGNFYEELESGDNVIILTGKINWLTGVVHFAASAMAKADGSAVEMTGAKLYYQCNFSLEQNTMNTRIKPTLDKVRLTIKDQEVSADWTIQLEQDANAMYDLDIQSAIIDILGQQMALDIDMDIMNDIIGVASLNESHQDTFYTEPKAGYSLGPIYWYQNIIQKLMRLSAKIYTDTNIGEANVIAANPMDAAILESLNKFSFEGRGSDGGAVGYTSGNLAQRWKVFSSPVVPQGKMILMHKPTDIMRVIYVWAPYQPAVMSPYPMGNTPSLTILSRNAKKFYRPMGSAILNIVEGQEPSI